MDNSERIDGFISRLTDDLVSVTVRFNDLINSRDLNGLLDLMTDDHQFVDSAGNMIAGREELRGAWRSFFDAFPDYRNVFSCLSIRGDRVLIEGRSECSDARLRGSVLWVAEVRDGRVSVWQVHEDNPAERSRLGIAPSVASERERVASMAPRLNDGIFAWCVVSDSALVAELEPVVSVREEEGFTVVVPEEEAARFGLEVLFRAAWITLGVASALDDVGLTAAFSRLLGRAGISCNVVAGAYHDHIFVPVDRGKDALNILASGT